MIQSYARTKKELIWRRSEIEVMFHDAALSSYQEKGWDASSAIMQFYTQQEGGWESTSKFSPWQIHG